jgi:hypothetical protein
MADPFNVTGSPASDPWQNLMAFGLATMAAGSQPGAKTLGALGQGGLAAMKSSRENAQAATQNQLYNSEVQGKNIDNALKVRQVAMQSQMLGLPMPDLPGMSNFAQAAQPQQTPAADSGSQIAPNKPSATTGGMTYSPSAGSSRSTGQQTGAYGLSQDVMDQLTSQEIGQLQQGMRYNIAGMPEAGKQFTDAALARLHSAGAAAGETPYKIQQANAAPQHVGKDDVLIQNSVITARGAQPVIGDGGAQGIIPAHMEGQSGSAPKGDFSFAQSIPNAPVGIRNNNPGNVRTASYDGGVGMDDKGYGIYATPEAGIRATSVNLRNYAQQGVNTPMSIAAKWAPAGDKNDPVAYGSRLAKFMGVDPNAQVDLNDMTTNAKATAGIMQIENGMVPYKPEQFSAGIKSAFTAQPSQAPAAQASQNGLPPGAIQTEISPAQKGYMEGRGKTMADQRATIDEEAKSARQANFILDQMKDESQGFQMGKWADAEATANKYLRTLNPKFDKPVANYEAFVKNAVTLTNEEVRQVSSRAAVQEYKAIQSSQPQAQMSPQGFKQIINQKYALNDYKMAKQAGAAQWGQSHPNMEGFENDFNKNVTPGIFLLHRMDNNEFAGMAANMQKTPEGRSTLQSMMKRAQFAQENGLFDGLQ